MAGGELKKRMGVGMGFWHRELVAKNDFALALIVEAKIGAFGFSRVLVKMKLLPPSVCAKVLKL